MRASLNPYRRNFFFKYISSNTNKTTEHCAGNQRLWSTWSYLGCIYQTSLLKAQVSVQKRRQKDCDTLSS